MSAGGFKKGLRDILSAERAKARTFGKSARSVWERKRFLKRKTQKFAPKTPPKAEKSLHLQEVKKGNLERKGCFAAAAEQWSPPRRGFNWKHTFQNWRLRSGPLSRERNLWNANWCVNTWTVSNDTGQGCSFNKRQNLCFKKRFHAPLQAYAC